MGLSVCPMATIAAPVETVWSLLDNPMKFNEWADGKIEWVQPEGPMTPRQKFCIKSDALGKSWRAVFIVEDVHPDKHILQTNVEFPFGMRLHERVMCTPIDVVSCRVQYG